MDKRRENEMNRERALRGLPEGVVPNVMDEIRCGLQTVVIEKKRHTSSLAR